MRHVVERGVQTPLGEEGAGGGTALLNTLAASALAAYLVGRAPTTVNQANAAIHSYVTAFWWAVHA